MNKVRQLEDNDLAAALDIYSSPRKVMRTIKSRPPELFINDFSNPLTKYVGFFDEEELIAFLKYSLWPNVPCASVGNLNIKHSKVKRYNFSDPNHPIIHIMDYILEELENSKVYTWLYNRSLTVAYHKLQLDGHDLLRNCRLGYDADKQQYRYDRYVDEVVEAGTHSEYSTHFNMAGRIEFDYPYMVVKCCLKMEYRKFPNYFDERVIRECLQNIR